MQAAALIKIKDVKTLSDHYKSNPNPNPKSNPNPNLNPNPKLGKLLHKMCETYLFSARHKGIN